MEKIKTRSGGTQHEGWLGRCSCGEELIGYAWAYVSGNRMPEFQAAWNGITKGDGRAVDQHFFLKEFCWCTYVAGFSAAKISDKFDALLLAHRISDAEDNPILVSESNTIPEERLRDVSHPIYAAVLEVFGNKRKAQGVQSVRSMIYGMGWVPFYDYFVKDKDPGRIQELPMMGPALSCQLARNLGNLSVVKPDVHLNRLAERYKYEGAKEMCNSLAPVVRQKPAWVDLVLWMACVDLGSRDPG